MAVWTDIEGGRSTMKIFNWGNEFINIKRMIDNDDIKVVSFDIFDTLLVRPAIQPKDILKIVADTILDKYNVEIYEDRMCAEGEIKDPYVKITDIWNHIRKKRDLDLNKVEEFIKIEIEFEKNFLYVRNFGKVIYDYALTKGKRIIAVSDMYLPTNILFSVLRKNGYDRISKIYVSCDCKARKDNGKLYDWVLKSELLNSGKNLIHIGDNYIADYKVPLKKGIHAFNLPSNISLFNEFYDGKNMITLLSDNPYENIIFGFAINELFDDDYVPEERFSLRQYSELIAFPILLHNALYILNADDIQENKDYDRVYFAARDGYLPMKAYQLLKKNYSDKKLEAYYLYASRRAYSCLAEDDIYYRMSDKNMSNDYTLEDFIITSVLEPDLQKKILSVIPEYQLSLSIKKCREECVDILMQFHDELKTEHEQKKRIAKKYYNKMFNHSGNRCLIFDCGYSGSVSNSLYHAFDKTIKFDKIYLWETAENKQRDIENGTKTFVTIGGNRPAWMDILIEDTFSPLQGSCIGFHEAQEEINPVYELFNYSEEMKKDLQFIQNRSMALVKRFGLLFGNIINTFKISEFQKVTEIALYYLAKKNLSNPQIYNNIVFPDSYCTHVESESLGDKMLHANKMLYGGPVVNIAYRMKKKLYGVKG